MMKLNIIRVFGSAGFQPAVSQASSLQAVARSQDLRPSILHKHFQSLSNFCHPQGGFSKIFEIFGKNKKKSGTFKTYEKAPR
jgi:hypothetical protein